MVKHVEGYMTKDGIFFYNLLDASKHEAEMTLRGCCAELPQPVNADRFILVLEALADECGKYLDAYQKINSAAKNTSGVGRDTGDNGDGSANADPMEQFEASGHEPLPNMGDRTSRKAVRIEKPVDGFRVRGDDARGIRSGQNMAVGPATEDEKTC